MQYLANIRSFESLGCRLDVPSVFNDNSSHGLNNNFGILSNSLSRKQEYNMPSLVQVNQLTYNAQNQTNINSMLPSLDHKSEIQQVSELYRKLTFGYYIALLRNKYGTNVDLTKATLLDINFLLKQKNDFMQTIKQFDTMSDNYWKALMTIVKNMYSNLTV